MCRRRGPACRGVSGDWSTPASTQWRHYLSRLVRAILSLSPAQETLFVFGSSLCLLLLFASTTLHHTFPHIHTRTTLLIPLTTHYIILAWALFSGFSFVNKYGLKVSTGVSSPTFVRTGSVHDKMGARHFFSLNE